MKRFPDPDLYPLEHEVVRLVDHYLGAGGWDLSRIPCLVEFGVRPRVPSSNDLSKQGRDGAGNPVGQIRIWYNFAYLHQLPGDFLNDNVAHECAHALAEIEAFRAEKKIEPHGDEWAGWLARLSHRARPESGRGGAAFNDLAIRLQKGGTPARCSCAGDVGFHVISAARRSKSEDICEHCGSGYRPVKPDAIPIFVRDEVLFIQEYLAHKDLSGWLG